MEHNSDIMGWPSIGNIDEGGQDIAGD